jgi:hypothetical protein
MDRGIKSSGDDESCCVKITGFAFIMCQINELYL